jgi:ABC-type multidrug transport system fused ATPase/permease subunit
LINLDVLFGGNFGRLKEFYRSPFARHIWSFIAPEKAAIVVFMLMTLAGGILASFKVLLSIAMLQAFLSSDQDIAIHVSLPVDWMNWMGQYGITEHFIDALVIAIALGLVTILGILIDYHRRRRSARLGAQVARRVTASVAKKIYAFRIDYFDKNRTGEVAHQIAAPGNAVFSLITSAIDALNLLIKFGFMYTTLVMISPLITVGISLLLVMLAYGMARLQLLLKPMSIKLYDASRKLSGEITESLGAIWLVKQFATENRASPRIRKEMFRRARVQIEFNDLTNFVNTSIEGITTTIYLIAAFVIFVLYKFGIVTDLGFAIGYLMALMRVIAEIRGGISLYGGVVNNLPPLMNMVKILENDEFLEPQPSGPEFPVDLKSMSELEMSGICYAYKKEIPVLIDVDMTFKKGGLYAIVGLSGSGKTTALEILSGMRLSQQGSIKIDDQALTANTIRSFRSQIGYGGQSPIMFQDSIRKNIGFGLIDPSQGLLEEAAQGAGIHDFISGLLDGYDSDLGVGGATVSGGQKQRISLARVLARQPEILLLDEITSALDTNSESHIMNTLKEYSKNRIVILATHRLYNLWNCDRIYVMHEGKLVEAGTHNELCQLEKGLYASLYNLQVQAGPPENVADETSGNGGLVTEMLLRNRDC